MTGFSVQPQWCLELPLQMQSVLLLATRGPDGAHKGHPSKPVIRAYRAFTLIAAKYGRQLRTTDDGDTFMNLTRFNDDSVWEIDKSSFLYYADEIPLHYYMHFMHGVEILGYKYPVSHHRAKWHIFYHQLANHLHVNIETERQMDDRLGDWNREYWDPTVLLGDK